MRWTWPSSTSEPKPSQVLRFLLAVVVPPSSWDVHAKQTSGLRPRRRDTGSRAASVKIKREQSPAGVRAIVDCGLLHSCR